MLIPKSEQVTSFCIVTNVNIFFCLPCVVVVVAGAAAQLLVRNDKNQSK